jgi:hypothetical protein
MVKRRERHSRRGVNEGAGSIAEALLTASALAALNCHDQPI